jgi:hypothetical protein
MQNSFDIDGLIDVFAERVAAKLRDQPVSQVAPPSRRGYSPSSRPPSIWAARKRPWST